MNRETGLSFLRATVRLAMEKEITFLAGSIAFFAFVSLVPAMVLVLAIGTVLGGEQFANGLVGLVEESLSDEGTTVLETALGDTTGLAGASIVGFVVLFWSTLKVFRALDIAFDRIYGVGKATPLSEQILNGSIVILGITTSLMVLMLVQASLRWLSLPYPDLVGVVLVLGGLLAVLSPIYYVMPPVSVSLGDVLPGTLFAVIGLVALQQLFHLYASHAGQYQAYGLIGAVLLFLLWLYFGGTILLVGVVINAVAHSMKRTQTESARDTSVPVTPHLEPYSPEGPEKVGQNGQDSSSAERSDQTRKRL